jgi:hypothetical protein
MNKIKRLFDELKLTDHAAKFVCSPWRCRTRKANRSV